MQLQKFGYKQLDGCLIKPPTSKMLLRSGRPGWRVSYRSTRFQAHPGSDAHKESLNSYRERLRKNPAYQRQKKDSWKDAYQPATGTEKAPGPIPEHLLAERASKRSSGPVNGGGGSITEQLRGAMEPPLDKEKEPRHASTSTTLPQQSATDTPRPGGVQTSVPAATSNSVSPNAGAGVQWSSDQRTSRVRFWIQFHAQFGQRMRVVGSHPELGSWNLSQGAELQWSPGDKWNVIVEIPAGAILEYKYVLLEGDGLRSVAWQSGNNSVLAVGHSDGNVEVFDNWESSPGASVLAGGEKTTREGRLLAWATEIESLFSSQRSELRRSRMELAAAQDEARTAREEARQMRAELRASEAERTKAELKVRELLLGNRLLKTQLADNTQTFRNALETTHMFLLEAEKAMLSQSKEVDKTDPGHSPMALLKAMARPKRGGTSSGQSGSGELPAGVSAQKSVPAASERVKSVKSVEADGPQSTNGAKSTPEEENGSVPFSQRPKRKSRAKSDPSSSIPPSTTR